MEKSTAPEPIIWSVFYETWHSGLGRRIRIEKSSDGRTRSVVVR